MSAPSDLSHLPRGTIERWAISCETAGERIEAERLRREVAERDMKEAA